MTKKIYSFLLLLISVPCVAQLCQGSLGDPIINISFGKGGNPGSSLAAAATGYQFVNFDCPGDGFYTVRNNTNACFFNSWHTLTSDHTANGNGYFMLVNASVQPSAFYVDTVRGLCGNSNYEFAAWLMNVILPSGCGGTSNQPNLTFTIEKTDGTVLQSYNSGNIPPTSSPVWKQYGFFFTTPATGADIVLRIVNNAPGGCGNDLALDDITFRPCGPLLTPSITGQTSDTVNICQGTAGSFNFSCTVSGGFFTPVFQWQQRFNGGAWADITGAVTTSLTAFFLPASAAGTYEYRLSVAEAGNLASLQCRISSQPLAVIINAPPVAAIINNSPVCAGSTLKLAAGGGSGYTWTGPGSFSATGAAVSVNNIQSAQAGLYNVTVTNAAGCSSMANSMIIVNPSPAATTLFSDTAVCINQTVQLSAAGGGTYEWIPATGLSDASISNPVASPLITTTYNVVVGNSFACYDTAFVNINVYTKAIANAGPDRIMIKGKPIVLSGSIHNSYLNFSWSPPVNIDNTQILTPTVSPPTDALYILTANANNGCGSSSDSVFIKVYNDVFIANAFTPNGDAKNDTWNIPALNAYPDFKLFVYNRYGQLVFVNSFPNKPWDGRFKGNLLPIGAYVYLVSFDGGRQVLKGTVMIVR